MSSITGVPEAPNDGTQYVRQNLLWEPLPIQSDVGNDNKLYARKNKAWSEIDIPTQDELYLLGRYTAGEYSFNAFNAEVATINRGDAVSVRYTLQGTNTVDLYVGKLLGEGDISNYIGIAPEDIIQGASGRIVSQGYIKGNLDTSSYDSNLLYLSRTGHVLTNDKQQTRFLVADVKVFSPTNGEIYVRAPIPVGFTYKIVDINSPSDFDHITVGDTIVPESNTAYNIVGQINIGTKYFKPAPGTKWSLHSSGSYADHRLISSVTGNPLFDFDTVSFECYSIGIQCPNTNVIEATNSGLSFISFRNTDIDVCQSIGWVQATNRIEFNTCYFTFLNSPTFGGLEIRGNCDQVVLTGITPYRYYPQGGIVRAAVGGTINSFILDEIDIKCFNKDQQFMDINFTEDNVLGSVGIGVYTLRRDNEITIPEVDYQAWLEDYTKRLGGIDPYAPNVYLNASFKHVKKMVDDAKLELQTQINANLTASRHRFNGNAVTTRTINATTETSLLSAFGADLVFSADGFSYNNSLITYNGLQPIAVKIDADFFAQATAVGATRWRTIIRHNSQSYYSSSGSNGGVGGNAVAAWFESTASASVLLNPGDTIDIRVVVATGSVSATVTDLSVSIS